MSLIQPAGARLGVTHPADFTPVCTTELGKMALYAPEFEKRGVKLLGFSCEPSPPTSAGSATSSPTRYYNIKQTPSMMRPPPASPSSMTKQEDIPPETPYLDDHGLTRFVLLLKPGCEVSYSYPIVADPTREVIRQLNMVDPEAKDADGAELPSRALHVVAGDKRIKLSILYPATTGRDLDEVLRVVDSLQATAKYRVATPVNWRPGQPVVISPSVTTEEAQKMFPRGYTTVDLPSKKEYLRLTKL